MSRKSAEPATDRESASTVRSRVHSNLVGNFGSRIGNSLMGAHVQAQLEAKGGNLALRDATDGPPEVPQGAGRPPDNVKGDCKKPAGAEIRKLASHSQTTKINLSPFLPCFR